MAVTSDTPAPLSGRLAVVGEQLPRPVVAPRVPVIGDPRHGVARYAALVADAVRAREPRCAGDRVHVHFTDRLWGEDPEAAAAAFVRAAHRTPTTVTLHDVPQASDGPRGLARRAAAYRRVVAVARGVVVNSRHEAALLATHVTSRTRPVVIAHAVQASVPPSVRPPADGEIVVLGFVYPGKGHREVIDAAAQLDGVGVVALGAPSAGHERDVDDLARHARRVGVAFAVTGFVPEEQLLTRCRRAAIPVSAHRHVSASGSLATWIGAGRRPLAPDRRYTREVAELRPGTVTPYPPHALAAAIEHALRDPGSTWIAPGTSMAPSPDDVAEAYLRWWSEAVAW